MESRMRSWIVFTACVLAVFAAIVGVLLLSENFHEVYDMVELQDGVLDLDSQVLLDHIGTNITGEWEFYYNKWIISEDTAATSDGIVNVGDSWKNIVIDGEKISGAGYASYKITVKNMYAGDEIYVGSSNYYVPHTIYINGKRVYAIGEMSKEYSTVWTTSEIYENTYQARNDEDIEIVIEVSGSDRGGLFMPIWLHTVTHNSGTYLGLYDIITYIAVGLMIAFVVFNFLMFIGVDKIYNKKTFAFFMLCLFLRYIVGVDGQKILHQHNIVPPYYTFKIAAVIFGFLMVAVFVKMIVEYGYITWRKKETIVLGTFFTLSTAASEIFRGYSYGWVPAIIGYISLLYIVFKLAFSKSERKYYVIVHAICFTLIIGMVCLEYMSLNGALIFGIDSVCSYVVSTIVIAGSIDHLLNMKKLQDDWVTCKEQFLRAQMTPHYMFNVLSAIMSEYRNNVDTADEYMVDFCDNLRNCIDLKDDTMIDFEDDIKVLKEQIKLINVAKNGRVKVTYDLCETNFQLPTFALQPLVENAIMHRNGAIKDFIEIHISSKKVDSTYQICVEDNGNGFDENAIPPGAMGIKNCRTRLELLADANLVIESEIGKGTKATIIINAEEK